MAFIPVDSTYDLWSDAGSPNFLATPITATTGTGIATYKGCDGDSLIDIPLTLVLVQVERIEENVQGTSCLWWNQTVRVITDGTTSDEDITVYLETFNREDGYPNPNGADQSGGACIINTLDFTSLGNRSVIIQAGQTVSNDLLIGLPQGSAQGILFSPGFPDILEVDWINQSGCDYRREGAVSINPTQFTLPTCAAPPVPCTLEITGVTTTDPTLRGSSDGSIVVSISGETGTTNYTLNGGTPQVSNTFTGLGAGVYSIIAQDGNCYDSTGATINDGEFRTGSFKVSEPSDYLASENPIITTLGTASNTGVPEFAVSTFTFDAGIENNYSVVFNLVAPTDYNATFTAKDFPNRENYFGTTLVTDRNSVPFGVNTVNEIADMFADAVLSDINISRWYFVSVTDNVVTLTAKEARSSLTLTSSNVDVLDETGAAATTGITLINTTVGNDAYEGSLVNDYSLYTDVYVGVGDVEYGEDLSGGTYQNFTSLELPFDIRTNIHQFDVSEIMKTFVSTPRIDQNFTGFTRITSMLRPFYVKYGENYALVPNTNTRKKRSKGLIDYKWVLNSSLDWEEANDMSTYFTGGTFLTNSPNPLDIQREQVNFLYFIIPKDFGETLTLDGDIDYYDGTSQTGITFINIASGATNNGGVYALNVSYDSLGLAAFEASGNTKVKRCTFAIYGDVSGILSEERTYRFEIDEQPRKFGVSFENKLGGYDTFDFVGIVEETIAREKKNYTIPRQIQSDGSSQEGFKNTATFDTKVTKKIVVNSGWIDEDHFDWLIELLSSNNVYSYSEPNQNYLNVDGLKYTKSSLDDLFELEVNFTATIYENNVTV